MKSYFALLVIILMLSVSCSKKSTNPSLPPADKITAEYFPAADGDTWYYSDSTGGIMVRSISGDTTINGVSCKRVLEGTQTAQAWSIDSIGFKVIYRVVPGFRITYEPPLIIRFNMEKDRRYDITVGAHTSINGQPSDLMYSVPIEFQGYTAKEVKAGKFNNVVKIHYIPTEDFDEYYEYYGKGVGLLSDDEYSLDSAFMGGVWYK